MVRQDNRAGGVAIIVALSITVLLMFAALAIDFTFLITARMRAQNAVDSAAHAGMVAFTRSEGDAEYAVKVAETMLSLNGISEGTVEVGAYDFDNDTFTDSGSQENSIRVSTDLSDILSRDLFIAPLLGMPLSDRGGKLSATSAIQPRELIFVLDQSCSMASGAKVASMKEGVLKSLETVLATDPNDMDEVALIGFGDSSTLHAGLQRLSTNYSAIYDSWDNGICLCTMDPYVQYYAYYYGGNPRTAQTFDLNTGRPSNYANHPLQTGDTHYGVEGHADLTYRCCEPHCNETWEASNPSLFSSRWWSWLRTYYHGNGAAWGMEMAMDEFDSSGDLGSHRVMIVLGDGIDFCPSDSSMMPEPCSSGGDLLSYTIDLAQEAWEDQQIHIYPIYYGTSGYTRDYYADLATGDGELFNPSTPDELEAVFSKIVARSQVALVQ
jgi:Flp pilus assembly protein TadG